jgi:hypothetical protein
MEIITSTERTRENTLTIRVNGQGKLVIPVDTATTLGYSEQNTFALGIEDEELFLLVDNPEGLAVKLNARGTLLCSAPRTLPKQVVEYFVSTTDVANTYLLEEVIEAPRRKSPTGKKLGRPKKVTTSTPSLEMA